MTKTKYDIIVIGGGPSGMMAAGRAGELGASVLLIEKNDRLGKKLSITGGRRCNITNAEFDGDLFLNNFPRAKEYLLTPFKLFNVKSAFEFFESRKLPLKIEARKRAFPVSEKAKDVCNVLINYINESPGVDVKLETEFLDFKIIDGNIVAVIADSGTYTADKYILAAGGLAAPETGSTGEWMSVLDKIGHTVKDPDPSLVPLKSPSSWVHALSGTTVEDVVLNFMQDDKIAHTTEGRVLFTHFGISGPTVINAANTVKDLLKQGEVTASIDLYPNRSKKMLDGMVRRILENNPKKLLTGIMKDLVQKKLGDTILDSMDPYIGDLKTSSISKKQRGMIVDTLKGLNFPITATMGFEWSIVADGGVVPDEIDFHNMTSKLFPNLYLIGDTININRPSGGFSLQLCWTTGWVAGTDAGSQFVNKK